MSKNALFEKRIIGTVVKGQNIKVLFVDDTEIHVTSEEVRAALADRRMGDGNRPHLFMAL